jgi:integrase
MRLLLTDRFCDRAKSEGLQTDYFDETVSGLALRVSKHGVKAWTLIYTAADGKRARMTLGRYPTTSLASARALALNAKADVEAGRDPRSAGKDETLRAVCQEYLRREASKLRTQGWREATLERLVYPALGHRPIAEIKRTEIIRLLDRIEDENGPVMADQALAFVRKVLNWHASRSDDFRSPIVRGMARTKPRDRARDRVLSDDEIRLVWSVADGAGVFGRYLQLLLLTATRRNEAAQMTRAELAKDIWTIPASRMKGKVEYVVPLTAAALAKVPDTGEFIFTTDGLTPISGFSKFKREFDAAVLAALRKDDPKAKPLPNWTLHDLRRTARSLMSRAGVSADVAERCLAHVIGGVRGVYDRHAYLEEKRAAFEALAGLIQRIVDPQPNVVAMRGAER